MSLRLLALMAVGVAASTAFDNGCHPESPVKEYCLLNTTGEGVITAVAAQPNGDLLLEYHVTVGKLKLRNTATGAVIQTWPWNEGIGSKDRIQSMKVVPGTGESVIAIVTRNNVSKVDLGGVAPYDIVDYFKPVDHTCIDFTPDGKYIVTGDGVTSGDPEVSLWNGDGSFIRALTPMHGEYPAVALSSDSLYVAAINNFAGKVYVWQLDGTLVKEITINTPTNLMFTPDSSALLVSTQTEVLKYTVAGLDDPPAKLVESSDPFIERVFSPDAGRFVALNKNVSTGTYTVRTWDLNTPGQESLVFYSGLAKVETIEFRRLNTIVSCTDDRKCLVSALPALPTPAPSTDAPPTPAPPTPAPVEPGCHPADTLTIGCEGVSENCAFYIQHFDNTRAVAFSPDGTLLLAGSDDAVVRVFDAATGSYLRRLACADFVAYDIAFSPDGTRVAVAGADGKTFICNVASGAKVIDLTTPSLLPVQRIRFSPDGAWVIAAGSDSAVRKWNAVTGGDPALVLEGYVRDAIFTQNSTHIATAGSGLSDPVEVWNAANGAKVLDFPQPFGDVVALSFTSSGTLLRGYADGRVLVSGTETTLNMPNGLLYDAKFSPNGAYIAASGMQDLAVWNVASGSLQATLLGHTLAVHRFAFSPNANRIASAGNDGVYIWNLPIALV